VWTRTFQTLEPLAELQAREWCDVSTDESDWSEEQSALDEEPLDAEEQ
jgi:hypothetical protein